MHRMFPHQIASRTLLKRSCTISKQHTNPSILPRNISVKRRLFSAQAQQQKVQEPNFENDPVANTITTQNDNVATQNNTVSDTNEVQEPPPVEYFAHPNDPTIQLVQPPKEALTDIGSFQENELILDDVERDDGEIVTVKKVPFQQPRKLTEAEEWAIKRHNEYAVPSDVKQRISGPLLLGCSFITCGLFLSMYTGHDESNPNYLGDMQQNRYAFQEKMKMG